MGCGIMLLALFAVETVSISRVVEDPDMQTLIENTFYAVIGGAWVLLHVLVFVFPNSRILRTRWETLAKMEADRECKFERREAA